LTANRNFGDRHFLGFSDHQPSGQCCNCVR
jgi:hypothetical protein